MLVMVLVLSTNLNTLWRNIKSITSKKEMAHDDFFPALLFIIPLDFFHHEIK